MSGSRQTNIHNERVKLTAGMVSNAGLAFIAGGVVTPLVTGQVSLGRDHAFRRLDRRRHLSAPARPRSVGRVARTMSGQEFLIELAWTAVAPGAVIVGTGAWWHIWRKHRHHPAE